MSDFQPLDFDDFWDGELLDEVNLASVLGTDRDRTAVGTERATIWSGLDPAYGRDLVLLQQRPYSSDAIRADMEGALDQVGLEGTVSVAGETGEVFVLETRLVFAAGQFSPG